MSEMTVDEIAQAMLDILDEQEHWAQGTLQRTYYLRAGGLRQARCLLGARCVAGGEQLSFSFTTRDAIGYLEEDEYIARLARIIREQYPDEIARIFPGGQCDSDGQLVYLFNDEIAQFPDIRRVIEKAAVA